MNQLLTLILLVLGVKALVNIVRRFIVNVIWQGLRDGWVGALSLRSSTIERSDIFNDNWPSMKNIFRQVLRRRSPLLEMSKFEENHKKHILLYGACSHMGRTAASIFVKYGYAVILIDTNFEKL